MRLAMSSANCWSTTLRSATSPLRPAGSAASPVESVTPATARTDIRMPNMPNCSEHCARMPAPTGSGLSPAHKTVHAQQGLLLTGVIPASLQRDELVWRSVRAVSARSPDTAPPLANAHLVQFRNQV